MKESVLYICSGVTMIIIFVTVFFLSNRIQHITSVKLEREYGRYVYAMNMLPYDERTGRIAEVQRNTQIPIVGFDFNGLKPVRAYLINGEIKDIQWTN